MYSDFDTQVYNDLRAYIDTLPVIDTHEHLPAYESEWKPTDVLSEFLLHYASSDLVSAGLPAKTLSTFVKDGTKPIAERWAAVEPYWPFIRFTGYGRALSLAAKDVYGVDHIGADTIETLNERFLAARDAGGHIARVLRDMCGIETSINDCWRDDCDPALYRLAVNIGPLVEWRCPADMKTTGKIVKDKVEHFVDYLDAVEKYLNKQLDRGAVCLKCALAYSRPLLFKPVDRCEAKQLFKAMARGEGSAFRECRAFTDFMMHFILGIAEKRGVFVQFHTGLQEGNGNVLANSDPLLLTNLFKDYPGVKFDLFHISYPFQGHAAALAKNFPNVYLDMCWAHIISPSAAMIALDDFLDAVPCNKIFAFGGDYSLVDGVYGHLRIAKDNVARVLAAKVSRGDFDPDQAKLLAERLFYRNAKEAYRL